MLKITQHYIYKLHNQVRTPVVVQQGGGQMVVKEMMNIAAKVVVEEVLPIFTTHLEQVHLVI